MLVVVETGTIGEPTYRVYRLQGNACTQLWLTLQDWDKQGHDTEGMDMREVEPVWGNLQSGGAPSPHGVPTWLYDEWHCYPDTFIMAKTAIKYLKRQARREAEAGGFTPYPVPGSLDVDPTRWLAAGDEDKASEADRFSEDDSSFAARLLRKQREQSPEFQAAKQKAAEDELSTSVREHAQKMELVRLESPSASGGKFWEGWIYAVSVPDPNNPRPTGPSIVAVEHYAYDVAVRFGPIGTDGQVRRVASGLSLSEALKALDKRQFNKQKKGYARVRAVRAHGGAE